MSIQIEITTALQEVPVTVTDKAGNKKAYKLKEMYGDARDKYLNEALKMLTLDDAGEVVGIKDYDAHQGLLISKCLYDEKDVQVTLEVIQTFPCAALKTLHAASEEINGMDKAAKKAAGND